MKPGELSSGKYANFAKDSMDLLKASMERYDPNKARLRSSFEAGNTFIKRFKLEPSKVYSVILPLELALPFDPKTLSEDIFNKDNPLPLAGSPTTAALALKKRANDDENFANKLASCMGVRVSDLNLDNDYISDDKEIKIWHRIARLNYYQGVVQNLYTNKEKFKFGRSFGCNATFDETLNISSVDGIGPQLVEMETALISVKISMLRDTFAPGGENADKPKADLAAMEKKLWQDRLIQGPVKRSFSRCIAFQTDNDGNLDRKTISDWNKDKKIRPMIKYMKVTPDKVTLFNSVLTSTSDCNMDFVEVRITTPDLKGESNNMDYTQVNYSMASRDNSIFRVSDDDPNTPLNNLRDFKEEFAKFRDDENMWNDDNLRRSIYDFRPMSDDALLAEMQQSISIYEDAMRSEDIVHSYSDILSKINSSLMNQALDSILIGEDNGKAIDIDIVSSAPVINEMNDPMNEDHVSDIDDILNTISGTSDIDNISLSDN